MQVKAEVVQVDVGKLDIISDGLIHYQMLRFCQNTRLAFLGRNTPTPLISDIFAKVDATILERFAEKVQPTLMANGLLTFAVLLT